MSNEWIKTLFPDVDKQTSKLPIHEKVIELSGPAASKGSSRSNIHEALLNYDISRIRGGKTKEVYKKNELLPIAELLKVPTNLSKKELVDEILRVWRKKYPEDFAE
jgi:hypothetical protein